MNFRLMALNIGQFVPDLSLIVIKQRINIRYKQILAAEKWEFLHDSTTVRLRGIYSGTSSQTIAVNQSAVTVTATGTTFAEYGVAAGWFFRVGSESQAYIVNTVDSNTQVTFETSYGGTTQTAAEFDSFQTIYSPSVGDVGEIEDIVYQQPLEEVTLAKLNTIDPERTTTGEPKKWCNRTKSTAVDGIVTFEVWPVPDQDYVVRVYYKKTVADLSADSDTPVFRPEVLEAGALWDCYRLAFAVTKNTAYIGLARDAKVDYETELRKMVLEDMQTASLPRQVRDVSGMVEYDNNYRYRRDFEE